MRLLRRSAVLLILATVIGGCGSYTKADFIAGADAICASTVRKVREIAPPSFTDGSAARMSSLAGYLAEVLPIVRSEATALRGLRRPAQNARDRAVLSRYLHALSQVVEAYGRLAGAAKHGDPAGVASAEAALRGSPVAVLAVRYGLRSCGTPGPTAA